MYTQSLKFYLFSQFQIDMPEIKTEYYKAYDETLYKDIKRDASGHYEKVLLSLVGKDWNLTIKW